MVNFIGLSLVITSRCVLDINDALIIQLYHIMIKTERSAKGKSKQAQNGWAERTQKKLVSVFYRAQTQ